MLIKCPHSSPWAHCGYLGLALYLFALPSNGDIFELAKTLRFIPAFYTGSVLACLWRSLASAAWILQRVNSAHVLSTQLQRSSRRAVAGFLRSYYNIGKTKLYD